MSPHPKLDPLPPWFRVIGVGLLLLAFGVVLVLLGYTLFGIVLAAVGSLFVGGTVWFEFKARTTVQLTHCCACGKNFDVTLTTCPFCGALQ